MILRIYGLPYRLSLMTWYWRYPSPMDETRCPPDASSRPHFRCGLHNRCRQRFFITPSTPRCLGVIRGTSQPAAVFHFQNMEQPAPPSSSSNDEDSNKGDDTVIDVVGDAVPVPTKNPTVVPLIARINCCPSLLVASRTYHCQRCLNHGLEIPRRGHKKFCRYHSCKCEYCRLVTDRKLLNREISKVEMPSLDFEGPNVEFVGTRTTVAEQGT